MAQSPGTFTGTGNMTTARDGATATLLPNGKVLIAGGYGRTPGAPPSDLASAELYDSSNGVFTATGDMTTARRGHSATLLPNGKVLISGGYTNGSTPPALPLPVASAELFDPMTGIFTRTGDMVKAGAPTAILLADGKVFLAHDSNGPLAAPAEIYDPATGTFSATGGWTTPLSGHPTATLLTDGTVLVALCCMANSLYDPGNGAFKFTGAIGVGADGYTATLLANGKVLFAGGDYENSGSARAELYDPATGTSTTTGNMTTRRFYHAGFQP